MYLLQPVMGSTAPDRDCLNVIMAETGHMIIRTRSKKMARSGTRMIPSRKHYTQT